MPRVYNVSHVTSANPMAVNIGLIKIRPGKFKEIPAESINAKTKQLHGNVIWIGESLPSQLMQKEEIASKPLPMDLDQVSSYLESLDLSHLKSMLHGITPSPQVANTAPFRRYVYTIRAACFNKQVILDPDLFYWLGRWSKLPNGDYQEI